MQNKKCTRSKTWQHFNGGKINVCWELRTSSNLRFKVQFTWLGNFPARVESLCYRQNVKLLWFLWRSSNYSFSFLLTQINAAWARCASHCPGSWGHTQRLARSRVQEPVYLFRPVSRGWHVSSPACPTSRTCPLHVAWLLSVRCHFQNIVSSLSLRLTMNRILKHLAKW